MKNQQSTRLHEYYARHGMMTEPGEYAEWYEGLPTAIGDLCQVVQNNLIHIFWAERYGRTLSESEESTVNVRSMRQKLALMEASGSRPLTEGCIRDKKQVGNCRDFSLMLTSILRSQGIPARARCGFGRYFLADHFEDHWVCETWDKDHERWVLVDAQLDAFQCQELGVDFDPTDVPREQFIVAGQGWQMCRQGKVDADQFGIFDMHGWWFIWGNVVRDLLSFNKIELLPWDILPGCMTHALEEPLVEGSELALYDGIASLTLAGDMAHDAIHAVYERDERFQNTTEILVK